MVQRNRGKQKVKREKREEDKKSRQKRSGEKGGGKRDTPYLIIIGVCFGL
jgi:hypothetical protein